MSSAYTRAKYKFKVMTGSAQGTENEQYDQLLAEFKRMERKCIKLSTTLSNYVTKMREKNDAARDCVSDFADLFTDRNSPMHKVCEDFLLVQNDADSGYVNSVLRTLEREVINPYKQWLSEFDSVKKLIVEAVEKKTTFDHYNDKMVKMMADEEKMNSKSGANAAKKAALEEKIDRNKEKLVQAASEYNQVYGFL